MVQQDDSLIAAGALQSKGDVVWQYPVLHPPCQQQQIGGIVPVAIPVIIGVIGVGVDVGFGVDVGAVQQTASRGSSVPLQRRGLFQVQG